jgi:hypothetical protein
MLNNPSDLRLVYTNTPGGGPLFVCNRCGQRFGDKSTIHECEKRRSFDESFFKEERRNTVAVTEQENAAKRKRLEARKNELEKERAIIDAKIALVEAQLEKVGK